MGTGLLVSLSPRVGLSILYVNSMYSLRESVISCLRITIATTETEDSLVIQEACGYTPIPLGALSL